MTSQRSVDGPSRGNDEDDNVAPLWKYVTKIGKAPGGGGNWTWKCNYCNEIYKGSHSRLRGHLLHISGLGVKACESVKHEHIQEMKKVVEQSELRAKAKKAKSISLPTSTTSNLVNVQEAKKRRGEGTGHTTALEKAFNLGAREKLDGLIGRMFYSGGLPFNLARNPYYIQSYTFAANNAIAGYKPPGYNSLRTSLLQRDKAHIENLLVPIKNTWKEKGVSIVSDGWSDSQRRPIINVMAVTESGPMFLNAVNAEGCTKDRDYIFDILDQAIKEVGVYNVVQVITDNAPVCKAAGAKVEVKYPHIFWTPCVVHTLNLALKNICAAKNTEANEVVYVECSWIQEIYEDVMVIKNFIMNHSMRLAMFNRFVKLKLLSVAETRFASVLIMLKRFQVIRQGLQDMVVSESWSLYRDDDVGKAQFVREKILQEIWWDKIDYIISFTEPIYDMLRFADTDKPNLHLIYDMWDSMIEKVKSIIFRHEGKRDDDESSFYDVVHGILVGRWNKSNTPLHCLAHSLNPKYYSAEWLSGGTNRIAPHLDMELSRERAKCLKRYFSNSEERRQVNTEYGKFSAGLDTFGEYDSLHDKGCMDPKVWWVIHGASTPNLQKLALRLLGHPCSSSCCERNWSTYKFIHSAKRNKMTPQRAEDLVYVHTNLRLLSRKSPEYFQGETKMWDVGGDEFDSLEGTGILEVANLSLDEPELEVVLFEDDNDEMEVGTN